MKSITGNLLPTLLKEPPLLRLLQSCFSCVQLCATPQTAAHQAPLSLGFSRQEYWSGLPFPTPMHESEKGKRSHSAMSNSSQPHGLQPTRALHPWDFPGKSTGVGCHVLLQNLLQFFPNYPNKGSQGSVIMFSLLKGKQELSIPNCVDHRRLLSPDTKDSSSAQAKTNWIKECG